MSESPGRDEAEFLIEAGQELDLTAAVRARVVVIAPADGEIPVAAKKEWSFAGDGSEGVEEP